MNANCSRVESYHVVNERDKSRRRNEGKASGGISNNRDFASLRAPKIESDLQLSSAGTALREAKLNTRIPIYRSRSFYNLLFRSKAIEWFFDTKFYFYIVLHAT